MRYFFCCILLFCLGCKSESEQEPERVKVIPELVYDELESIMPGSFIAYQNYLLWTDPMSNEGFIHIIDVKGKKEIASLINMGNGPEEFITPSLGNGFNNEVVVFDDNNDKMATFNIESFNDSSFQINYQSFQTKSKDRIVGVENSEWVILSAKENPIIQFGTQNFGSIPFTEKAENYNYIMQGNLLYNPQRKCLVYANMSFPYLVLYEKKGNRFEQTWERKGKFDYKFVNNKIKIDNRIKGPSELALCKDYILTRERDYKNDPLDESTVRGRDFLKLPTTVFVYDYDSNLIKIVDLGMPVLRIAANEYSNNVYAIVVNPDFQIVRFKI